MWLIRCLVNCEIGYISHRYGWSIYSRGKKVFADRNRLTAGRVLYSWIHCRIDDKELLLSFNKNSIFEKNN